VQNELGKLVPGTQLPTSTRTYNKYSHTARDNDRRRYDGGLGDPTPRTARAGVFPASVGAAIGGGKYDVSVGIWVNPIPSTGDATWETIFDATHATPGILINQPEVGRKVHRIDPGAHVFVESTGAFTEDDREVYVVNYNFAIRDFRLKEDGTCIEATTEDSDKPTFTCKVDTTLCDDAAPVAADRVLHSSGKSAETMLTDHEKVSEMSVLMYAQQFGDELT
jgi:hypothetical protein